MVRVSDDAIAGSVPFQGDVTSEGSRLGFFRMVLVEAQSSPQVHEFWRNL